jgi:hypothetical protein
MAAAGSQAALAKARTERHVVVRSCIEFLSTFVGATADFLYLYPESKPALMPNLAYT